MCIASWGIRRGRQNKAHSIGDSSTELRDHMLTSAKTRVIFLSMLSSLDSYYTVIVPITGNAKIVIRKYNGNDILTRDKQNFKKLCIAQNQVRLLSTCVLKFNLFSKYFV